MFSTYEFVCGRVYIQAIAVSSIYRLCFSAFFNDLNFSTVSYLRSLSHSHLPFLIDVEFISQDKVLCCSNKQLQHHRGLKQQRSISYSCYLSPKDPGWWSSHLTWTLQVTIPERGKNSTETCTDNQKLSHGSRSWTRHLRFLNLKGTKKYNPVTQSYFSYSGGGK